MDKEAFDKWQRRRSLFIDNEEERQLLCRYRDLNHGRRKFAPLPIEASKVLLEYLPTFGEEWLGDLAIMQGLLRASPQDLKYYSRYDDVLERIAVIERVLRDEHQLRFGTFAVLNTALSVPASFVTPERAVVHAAIGTVHRMIKEQRVRWEFVREWGRFYDKQVHTPCFQLRLTLRRELGQMDAHLRSFLERYHDAVAMEVATELNFLKSRVAHIEAMGDPTLKKRDIKNMFWSLDLPFDDSVSETYPRTITFRQAETLGLLGTSRISGYIWEDKGMPPAHYLEEEGQKQKEVEEREAVRRAAEEERVKKERAKAEATDLLQRAREAVELRMGQRLWTQLELYRMHYKQRWAGCELCGTEYVHWIAAPRIAGATDDLVLCDECSKEYEAKPVLHRDYYWLWLSHFVNDEYSKADSIAEVLQMVRDTVGPREFNKDALASSPPRPATSTPGSGPEGGAVAQQ